MAYMSQENKKSKALAIKTILKKYGLKGSIGVHNHSTLVLNITSGKIDFLGEYNNSKDPDATYIDVNPYWLKDHYKEDGDAVKCLAELKDAMNEGNHNKSDAMIDYFDVGWYIDINVGKWNKPYIKI